MPSTSTVSRPKLSGSSQSYNSQIEDVLAGLARQHNGLDDFLSSIFSFFERGTDLFHVMQSKEDAMGFPPGVAEQMVVSQFRHFAEIYQKRTGNRIPENVERVPKTGVEQMSSKTSSDNSSPSTTSTTNSSPQTGSNLKDTMTHISTWNGAITDKYRWSQSLNDMTLEVTVATQEHPSITTKDLKVDIKPNSVKVECKGNIILNESFTMAIFPNESIWNLEDRKRIVFSLEKVKKTWWKSAFHDGPEIDTTKVESTKKVEDYDGATQGTIRKIVFDQNQKHKGLPTSDQIKTNEMMKNAWNAEGSPFQGTDFDPSMINLTNNLPDELMKKT